MNSQRVPNDVDLITDSLAHLLTISFAKTNSKFYPLAVNLAGGAAKYCEQVIGGTPVHFAAFAKTKSDATRSLLLLGYIQEWKTTQIFANGRLLLGASRVFDVLR